MSRIPRLELEQLSPDLADYLAPRVQRLGYLGELFKCAGHAPDVLLQFMHFTDALKKAMPERLTELGALTVAGYMQNDYERNQHERLCKRLGIPTQWIAAVSLLQPDQAPELSELEQTAQRYALAALRSSGHEVEAEFSALVAEVKPACAMAFVLLIGRYVTHALVVNTLQLRPPVPSIFERP